MNNINPDQFREMNNHFNEQLITNNEYTGNATAQMQPGNATKKSSTLVPTTWMRLTQMCQNALPHNRRLTGC
jgi:hypothetical protein